MGTVSLLIAFFDSRSADICGSLEGKKEKTEISYYIEL